MHRRHNVRPAITVIECTAALAGLALAIVLVTQSAVWAVAERQRSEVRRQAVEAVVNLVEAARAQPWEELTPEWAARQEIPAELCQRLTEPELLVQVEPDKELGQVRRVTVELAWEKPDGTLGKPVRMVALIGPRSVPAPGVKK